MYVCIYINADICKSLYLNRFTFNMYICVYTYLDTYIHTCIYIYMDLYTNVYMYIYIYTYLHTLHLYIYIYWHHIILLCLFKSVEGTWGQSRQRAVEGPGKGSQRGPYDRRADIWLESGHRSQSGQRAVERKEGHRQERGPQIGKRTIEGTQGCRGG